MKVDLDTLQDLQRLANEMTADIGLAESIAYSVFNLDAEDEDVTEQVGTLAKAILALVSNQLEAPAQPAYEPDDGPLTPEQIERIRAASTATKIPESNFTEMLWN